MKYTQIMHDIMSQTGSWIKQIFPQNDRPLSVMPKESELPKALRLPKNAALESKKVGIIFIRWLEYMIHSGNFVVNHPSSPIHKPCKSVIGIVKNHAIALFCEVYGLNDYWTPYPKNSLYKAIKKTPYFLSAYGSHTFICHVKSKHGRIHTLPLLLIDETYLKLENMNISINHSLIFDHQGPFDNQRKTLKFNLKLVAECLLIWQRRAEAAIHQKHTGTEWVYAQPNLEQHDSSEEPIQTETGTDMVKTKTFTSFDSSLLPPLPDYPLLSKEMGEFFIQWLKLMIKHRRFEVNENNSPVHKITTSLIGIMTPKIFMLFCKDYDRLIDGSNNPINQIRHSVKKAGYLISHAAAKKEIFKCNVLGKPQVLYFCLIHEKHLLEYGFNIPVDLTLTLQETPRFHPKK